VTREAAEATGRPDPPPFDRAVLEGVRAGRPEALAEFFEAAFADVYGLAFRLLGDPTGAEDVTQEVFLRVQRAAATLDVSRDPRPWLRTITANLCRDLWRSFGHRVGRQAVPVDEDPEVGVLLPDGGPAPDDALLKAERDERVQDALAALPYELREVVLLRDWEGLDHAAVARQVGASEVAVRKRYSRALARLGELLRDVWP